MKEISELIINTTFKGLEQFDISKVLTIFSSVFQYKSDKISRKGILKEILRNCLIDDYIYVNESKHDSKILFFYSHTFFRVDHFNTFKNIASIVENRDIIYPKYSCIKKKKIILLLKLFPLVVSWVRTLYKIDINRYFRYSILNELISLYKFKNTISKIKPEKYNLFVSYYDVSPLDNMLVQYFKNHNVKTATLQHGTFVAKRPQLNNFDFAGIELTNTISDYFLAWNEFTKNEALKAGISEEKIKVLGIPKYANYVKSQVNKRISNQFGVILNVVDLEQQNVDLIKYANDLAKEFNLNYKIKYHPNFKGNEYDNYVNYQFYKGSFPKDTKIEEYSNLVDFTLISNSSVFVELVYLKHLTFRLVYHDMNDKYLDLHKNTFDSKHHLFIEYRNSKLGKNNIDSMFNYLCSCEDVCSSYKNFFKEFTSW